MNMQNIYYSLKDLKLPTKEKNINKWVKLFITNNGKTAILRTIDGHETILDISKEDKSDLIIKIAEKMKIDIDAKEKEKNNKKALNIVTNTTTGLKKTLISSSVVLFLLRRAYRQLLFWEWKYSLKVSIEKWINNLTRH